MIKVQQSTSSRWAVRPTLWDRWSGPGVPNCTNWYQYRAKFKSSTQHARFELPNGEWFVNWSNVNVECIYYRRYDNIFKLLLHAELGEVMRVTNCIKPCKYREYKVVGESRQTTMQSRDFSFSLWAISKNTEVKREELIYPFSSFLAEFGGILGLFLGFSFMSLWDQI